MKDTLELIFSSLWTFCGTVILIAVIGSAMEAVAKALKK